MDHNLLDLFASGSSMIAAALLGICLNLIIHAIKDLRDGHPEGFLYLTIASFLGVAQYIAFKASTEMQGFDADVLLMWALKVFIPAMLGLFFFRSLVSFIIGQGREGLVKLFFGATLVCFVYMIGISWPVDIKLILALIWSFFLFKSELSIAT